MAITETITARIDERPTVDNQLEGELEAIIFELAHLRDCARNANHQSTAAVLNRLHARTQLALLRYKLGPTIVCSF